MYIAPNSMELLVGVEHDLDYLSGLEKLLNERFPTGIDSMMVEIPSDFDILRTALPSIYGHVDDLYFFCLDNKYKKEGTRVIYGDIPLGKKHINTAIKVAYGNESQRRVIKVWRSALAFIDALTVHKRDKFMVEAIEREDPQVVVVGRRHADYIKRRFPEVPYVGYQNGGKTPRWLKWFLDDKLPDEIVRATRFGSNDPTNDYLNFFNFPKS